MNTKKIIAALVAFTAAATLGACTNPDKTNTDKRPAPVVAQQPSTTAPAPTAPTPTTQAPTTPTAPATPRAPITTPRTTVKTPAFPSQLGLGRGSAFTYNGGFYSQSPVLSDGFIPAYSAGYSAGVPDNTVSADTSHADAQARFAAAQAALLDANNALTDAQARLSDAQDAEAAARGALADAKAKEADAKAVLDAAMKSDPAGAVSYMKAKNDLNDAKAATADA